VIRTTSPGLRQQGTNHFNAVNLLLSMFGKIYPIDRPTRGLCNGGLMMNTTWIDHGAGCGPFTGRIGIADESAEDLLVASCLAAAAQGDTTAYFDLGVAYSTGSHGIGCDLIEAHKWFNLAAIAGIGEAKLCRADISEDMTAREIAEAQRRAREWIAASARRAA
jgi:TPR repeat protein